ncbi:hypothetical protein [uncultured Cellulomonas sp.]|uniref:hypothetical protein n=1 Tax=uncultured Cellulomonas sp. TaxID=189682 RepID=UPI002605FC31|nr:hypothetical protein [uncultured Cellulomonas sp.]
MPEYVCLDGPLSGQQLDWRDVAVEGELVTIGLVDVGQDDVGPHGPTEADYVVERVADVVPGRLRFVAGRGAWHPDALLAAPVPA